MKKEFTIEIAADNNFSILNRILNVLNRRRVRIKKLLAHENEDDFRRGGAVLLLYATTEMIERVKHQFEKLIEVDEVKVYEGNSLYFQLNEKIELVEK